MLKEWHFNVLFFVGVGGALILLFGPEIGLDVEANPMSAGGVGAILTFVLTQKRALTKTDDNKDHHPERKEVENDGTR